MSGAENPNPNPSPLVGAAVHEAEEIREHDDVDALADGVSQVHVAGEEDVVKLFMGQLPRTMVEADVRQLVEEALGIEASPEESPVLDVSIIRDKATGFHRGAAFVFLKNRAQADTVISTLHLQRLLPRMRFPMQVKYADGEMVRLEHKVFIGMLPKMVIEDDVRHLCAPYGELTEVYVVRNKSGESRGCAFVKFVTRDSADHCISELHQSTPFQNGNCAPLVVRYADSEPQRRMRKVRRSQRGRGPLPPPHLRGGPPSSGAGAGGAQPPPLGHPLYHHPHGHPFAAPNPQMMYHHPHPQVHHQMMPGGGFRPMEMDMGGEMEVGSGAGGSAGASGAGTAEFPALGESGEPMPMMNPQKVPISTPDGQMYMANVTRGGEIEGPAGANLFIYHLPPDCDDGDLVSLFSPFGHVISAKVFRDLQSKQSKCFGFVSYADPQQAQCAIQSMNGYQTAGKRLRVQLKRPKQRQGGGGGGGGGRGRRMHPQHQAMYGMMGMDPQRMLHSHNVPPSGAPTQHTGASQAATAAATATAAAGNTTGNNNSTNAGSGTGGNGSGSAAGTEAFGAHPMGVGLVGMSMVMGPGDPSLGGPPGSLGDDQQAQPEVSMLPNFGMSQGLEGFGAYVGYGGQDMGLYGVNMPMAVPMNEGGGMVNVYEQSHGEAEPSQPQDHGGDAVGDNSNPE